MCCIFKLFKLKKEKNITFRKPEIIKILKIRNKNLLYLENTFGAGFHEEG